MEKCSKCNSILLDDDIFCSNCGTKIDGKHDLTGNEISNLKIVMSILLGMFLKPVTTMKKSIETIDRKISVFMFIILAFIEGLVSMVNVNQVLTVLPKRMANNSIYEKISGILGMNLGMLGETNEFLNMIGIPYFSIFLQGIGLLIILIGTIIIGTFLYLKYISKKEVSIDSLLKLAIFTCIPFIWGQVLLVFLNYISFKISVVILLISIFLSFSVLMAGLTYVFNEEGDKLSIYTSIIFICTIIMGLMIEQKFITMNIEKAMGTIMNSIGNLF